MRKQLTMESVALTPFHAVSGVVSRPALFTVRSGRVWVTVEGCGVDYWLNAGQSLLLTPARLVVIEAAQMGATCRLSQRDHGPVRSNGQTMPRYFGRQHPVRAFTAGVGMLLRGRVCLIGALAAIVLATGCEVQRHSHMDDPAAVAARGAAQPGMAAVFVTARRMTPAEKHAYDDAYLVSQAPCALAP